MKTTLESIADQINGASHPNLCVLVSKMTSELAGQIDKANEVCEYVDVIVSRTDTGGLKTYAHATNELLHAMDDWLLSVRFARR